MFELIDIGHGHYCLFLDQKQDLLLGCLANMMGLPKAKLLEVQIDILLRVQRSNFESRFAEEPKKD